MAIFTDHQANTLGILDGATTTTSVDPDLVTFSNRQLGIGGTLTVSEGLIAIRNEGTQSAVDFYCESSNAHYARLQAPAHSTFSGNHTITLPSSAGTIALTSDIPSGGGDADTVDGKSISVVTSLPASPDSDTIYFVTG